MAAPEDYNHLRIPGTLVKDPTNLSAAYPFGGTILGLVGEIVLRYKGQHHPITAEEWGEQVVDVIHGGTSVLLAATLRGIDEDAHEALWLDTATGSPSGDTKIRFRVDNGRAGSLLSTKGMKLLFVPEDWKRIRGIILRDAIPVVTEDAAMPLSADKDVATDVVFYGRPDSSDRVAEIAYIGDMSL